MTVSQGLSLRCERCVHAEELARGSVGRAHEDARSIARADDRDVTSLSCNLSIVLTELSEVLHEAF